MEQDKTQTVPAKPVPRLCSEIQLFDLCDLERCTFKAGRFCTQEELLASFEHLPDEDESLPQPSGPGCLDGESDDNEIFCANEDDFEDLDDGFDPEEDDWQD